MNMAIEPTTIHTDRLLLRPSVPEDFEDVFAFLSNEEYAFFGSPDDVSRDAVATRLTRLIDTPWQERIHFAIVLKETVIGEIDLIVDQPNQVAELGYGIAREHWGKGLATEAARAVLDYGFGDLNLAKICARIDPRNTRSVRVVEKLGMQQEGLARSQLIRRGERVDRAFYGLLQEEWVAMK